MKNIITIIILPFLIMASCSAKKITTKTPVTTEAEKTNEEQIIKEGYIRAMVVDNTKSECGFVLKKIPSGEIFLPINLEDSFKKDGIEVWLKFRPIKPVQAACVVGMPINIEEIKLIE